MKGLALEGGGAKGSYQVGAYKALKEMGYEFDYIVGTSIGAINGAMFVQGDEKLAEKIWLDIEFSMVVSTEDDKLENFFKESLTLNNVLDKVSLIKDVIFEKGFDTTPLKNLLINNISEERIRNSNTKFGLVTLDITNRKPVETFADDVPEGKLMNYIYGSSNLLVFKQEPIDGKILIDGGYYANNPVKMLEGKCDEIINIVLFPNRNIPSISQDIDLKVIAPREKLIEILNFNKDYSQYGINLGYYDTYKYFYDLYGEKYYIKRPELEVAIEIFSKCFDFIKDKYPYVKSARYYFEKWLPDYFNKLGIDSKREYGDCLCFILEKIAVKFSLDRFRIYNIEDLAKTIIDSKDFNHLFSELEFEKNLVRIICEYYEKKRQTNG